MADIVAGVVLYNPSNLERTSKCLALTAAQVPVLYIFDNSVEPVQVELPMNAVYMTEHRNVGMGRALNELMRHALNDGHDWVLTMDQDSLIPDGLVAAFSKRIDSGDNHLALVCPQFVDRRRPFMKADQTQDETEVTRAITSASCTSIAAWQSVGGFDEWLFIDLVDNEFCARLDSAGYQMIRLNDWVLDQEFGVIEPKSPRQQHFWLTASWLLHVPNLAKFSYRKQVSPMRMYYTHRNIIYTNRKLRRYRSVGYDSYNCKGYLGFLVNITLPSILRAQHKWQVIRAIVRGTRDGLKAPVEAWSAPEPALREVTV